MMNQSRILSIAAIVLGIYIIFTYFLNKKPEKQGDSNSSTKPSQSFHIGCYLTQQKNLNQHDNLILRIQQLKRQVWKKQKKSSSIITTDYMEKKGVQVSRNFQTFINDYIKYKSQAQTYIQISRAVALAKQQFKNCQKDYHVEFSTTLCLEDWQSYHKCNTDLSILKTSLNAQIDQKQKNIKKINQLMGNNARYVSGPRKPSDEFEIQFKRKDKELQDKQKRLETEIKLLDQKVSQAQYYYQVARNKTIHSLNLYLQCSENRIQFRLCQQLTRQMQNLGYGSLQKLQGKVQRKRSALLKMKKLRDQNQGRQSSVELKRLYEESLKDFTRLYHLFYNTKLKVIKHCGCAQSDQAKLKQSKDNNKKYEQQKLKQYLDLKQLLSNKIFNLNQTKQQRQNLQKQLQRQMKKLSSPSNNPQKVDRIKLLSQLSLHNQLHQSNILESNIKFKNIQQKCNRIKQRISNQIPKISHIKDCLNKYQYYSQIKRKFQREAPKQIKMSQNSKIKLSKSLNEFLV